MKKHIKKHFAILLSVCLVLGMLVPIPVRGEGEEIYLVLSKETVIKSSKDQTIEMSVRMPVDTEYVGYTYKIVEDGVITKASVTKPDSSKVVAQMISSTDYKEGYG